MAGRRKDDGPTERHHLLVIMMGVPRGAIPHHLDPGVDHGEKGDGHAMARRDRPTDYEREQQREIDEDAMAAGGRKKRKKGGKVKGLTAHHRMDRHHRRQLGGVAPGIPGAGLAGGGLGGAGGLPPTVGAGALGVRPPVAPGAAGMAGAPGLTGLRPPMGAPGGLGQMAGGMAPGMGGMPTGSAAMPPGGVPATGAGANPLGAGASPLGMKRGGRLPAAMKRREYNGVTPPQKRQVGGGVRVPPRPVGQTLGAGRGGMGLAGLGGARTAPSAISPRISPQPQARALLGGQRVRGMARGGRSSDDDKEDEHNPCNTGGRLQAGGGAFDDRRGVSRRERRDQPSDVGGRGRTRGSRFGEKWIGGHGVEATRRVDRSRGAPILEDDVPNTEYDPGIYRPGGGGVAPGLGPDDNMADTTGPAFDNRDFTKRGGGVSVNMAGGGRLTAKQRQGLPKSEFALPGRGTGPKGAGAGSYPIPDRSHAANALSRVSQHGSPAEKKAVRAAVHRKYPGMGK